MDSTTGRQYVVPKKQVVVNWKVQLNGVSVPVPEYRGVTWKIQGGKNSAYFAGFDEPQTKRIRGGERVMDVIKDIVQGIACFVQMTCDQWLCVAKPRYDEKPYGKLVFQIGQEGHVKAVSRRVSIGERFSIYLANSRYRRDKTDKGLDASYKSAAFDPSPAFFKWTDGGDSMEERLYKPTILEAKRNGRNATMLRRLVRRKMEEALVKGSTYEWQVMGHRDPSSGLLYAPDAAIEVQDEMNDLIGDYYITDRTFRKDLTSGTTTTLKMIPSGIWLVDSDGWTDEEYADYMHWKADF
jgi:prophage tail gpP-like protein